MTNQPEFNNDWQSCLTPEQYRVLREKGTEQAFIGKYYNHHADGIYVCAGCGQELFSSSDKFDSGTGWPSFVRPAAEEHVEESFDTSHGMSRTEVLCSKCKGHLGHVFDDGPAPTGLRYCINSASLEFEPSPEKNGTAEVAPLESEEQGARALRARAVQDASLSGQARPRSGRATDGNGRAGFETATLAGGCFWCTEAVFESIDGVKSVKVGYTGGRTDNPTYEQVCSGDTGHAEVAQITFDPAKVSFSRLLEVFWKTHDPTTLNRQGADVGTQYRSAIFYHSENQRKTAGESIAAEQKKLGKKVVTEVTPASAFYEAENYHQDYFRNNRDAPYCRMIIAPKLRKLGENH